MLYKILPHKARKKRVGAKACGLRERPHEEGVNV